jgi:hypothetical protein
MLNGGVVRTSDSVIVHDYSTDGDEWNGQWKWSSPNWMLETETPDDGMFYFETDVMLEKITSNSWETTIVTTGSIEISGSPYFTNHQNAPHSAGIQNLFIIEGDDLKFNGNLNQSVEGIMYAEEQIQMCENATLNEFILVGNDASAPLSGKVDLNESS